ncbi:alpha/beta hydrolase [Patescibacteria group bacterium]|nr:alpha/beta hydrolase [Patescibacteria group bacterium]
MIYKTLIILPGWGGSHETWADFVELAKKEFSEVRVIDLPCFGDEPCPTKVWGVEDYSEFVKSKISNQKSAIILGHSFGGAVATRVVFDNPNIVDKLILSGAAIYRPKKPIRRLFFGLIAMTGKYLFRLPIIEKFDVWGKKILYKATGSTDYNETAGIKREIFKKIIREDRSELLHKIKIPTLVTWGTKDSFVPIRYGKKICESIPDCKMKVFKNGKHGLHIQMPKEFLNAIIDFAKM